MSTEPNLDQRITAVRRFNRFYTQKIGVLGGYLKSPFSLTEVRVLYELAHREHATATQLGRELGIDAGYLSRILRGFERRGFIARTRSDADGRQNVITLTPTGHGGFAPLDARSRDEIAQLLGTLSDAEQAAMIASMSTIERVLGAPPERPAPYLLRAHQPGDMGWVVQRHGVLYAREYGWDETFEALVAEIAAAFIRQFDPKRERCWIAERDGEPVGSVFLVRKSDEVAQLRLLLVEPAARGLGIGRRLVDECVRFARLARYRSITLWTNSVLLAARHLYVEAGFRLTHEEPYHGFGHDLVAETWALDL